MRSKALPFLSQVLRWSVAHRIESLRRQNGEVVAHLRSGVELPVARNRREELERKLARSGPEHLK